MTKMTFSVQMTQDQVRQLLLSTAERMVHALSMKIRAVDFPDVLDDVRGMCEDVQMFIASTKEPEK